MGLESDLPVFQGNGPSSVGVGDFHQRSEQDMTKYPIVKGPGNQGNGVSYHSNIIQKLFSIFYTFMFKCTDRHLHALVHT